MGKIENFNIILKCGVYYPGQNLEGSVILDLREAMKMKALRLVFRGEATVSWSEDEGMGDDRKTTTYSANERYFNFEMLLLGEGRESTMIPPGHYEFPFVYTLPPYLPPSFQGSAGFIRYEIVAKLDRPWKFDIDRKIMFSVVGALDLNGIPAAPMAGQAQGSKTVCCLCCESGPITAVFCTDRTGYVPGETILINAEIMNNSSYLITQSRVRLYQVAEFHATAKSCTGKVCVASVERGGIPAYNSDIWSGDPLVVPILQPSFLPGCSIIDLHYVLQLEVSPEGPSFTLGVPLDIIIGTIPLFQNNGPNHQTVPTISSISSNNF